MVIEYEEYYQREDIKLRLVAYGSCNKTMVTFLKDKYNDETYRRYLSEFKMNKNIHKIVKIENEIEEVILDRQNNTICSG